MYRPLKVLCAITAAAALAAAAAAPSSAGPAKYYPDESGGSVVLDTTAEIMEFLLYETIYVQGTVTFEDVSVDLGTLSQKWRFDDGGVSGGAKVIIGRDIAASEGGVVTLVPDSLTGGAADTSAGAVVVTFRNPNFYMDPDAAKAMFVLDADAAAAGWTADYNTDSSVQGKVTYIALKKGAAGSGDEEGEGEGAEGTAPELDDGGGGGGCNAGAGFWILPLAAGPALLYRYGKFTQKRK